VTAGRFALSVDRRGVPEGRFVYGRSHLARAEAVPLDPMELKLYAVEAWRERGEAYLTDSLLVLAIDGSTLRTMLNFGADTAVATATPWLSALPMAALTISNCPIGPQSLPCASGRFGVVSPTTRAAS
jgi:hypothetical protein